MSNATYVPFSMMGEGQKKRIDKEIDEAFNILEKIREAPEAAKENLMKTDFQIAGKILSFVGRLLSSESGMAQAMAVLADRAGKSKEFSRMISDNLPGIMLPAPKSEKK